MIDYCIKYDEFNYIYNELNRKLDKILKLENLNNNLIEQSFCNHGFPINLNKNEDKMLKEIYDNIRKKYFEFMD